MAFFLTSHGAKCLHTGTEHKHMKPDFTLTPSFIRCFEVLVEQLLSLARVHLFEGNCVLTTQVR